MSETFLNGKIELHCGDMLAVLPTLAENSIDSVVCDPPYHLQSITKRFAKTGRTDKTRTSSGPHQRTARGFMNTLWDGGNVAFRVETWQAVLRVMKPGSYIIAFSSTRTFGRMSVAIEDAGFITHPFVAWIFGQGFPKAHRVHHDEWEGWRYGTQSLKPAIEPIYVGQKPFEAGLTGTENVIKWGVGALNIDGCRIGIADTRKLKAGGTNDFPHEDDSWCPKSVTVGSANGRWPANVILSDDEEVLAAFPDVSSGALTADQQINGGWKGTVNCYGTGQRGGTSEYSASTGSAARFFYSSKADADDRLGSRHPTVKPLDLMQYLVRLVTPKGGVVLDCFSGTGTTGEAAWREGFHAVLIEREPEYQNDIRRRMKLCLAGPDERARESIKEKTKDKPVDHGPLFGMSAVIQEAAE